MMHDENNVAGIYEGEALRAVAFPLGGIGTGHFCICGDGAFRQWQIFNQVNHLAHLPGTFLAIRTQSGREEPKGLVLQCPALYDDEAFEPAPSVSDHVVPAEGRQLARDVPTVGSIRMVGRYPIAQLEYGGHDLPVEVGLTAFNPMIPLDEKNSGLPIAFLILRIRSRAKARISVSLMASLQNAVGWDGLTPIKGISNPLYGGNRNALIKREGSAILLMDNPVLEDGSPGKGEMAIALLSDDVSARSHWSDVEELWADFITDGKLTPSKLGPSSPGQTHNGALSTGFHLEPGDSRDVTFVIAWYFPNRYVNWDQRGFGVEDQKTRFWLGNMYNNWFGGALDVIEYAKHNFETLRRDTELFGECLFQTSLPWPVLDAISSQMSTIRSPTCFRQEDGKFFGFEGCRGSSTGSSCESGGCCPLNCTHVWNYEQTLSKLYPALERTMREVDLGFQMGADGRIPHRTVLPLYLPRWHDEDRTSAVYAADGHCGTILKAYREYRASGDNEFLDRHWPALKKALEFALGTWDEDLDGVFDGPQWNTYDCHLYGHNSFVSGLYLAALRAMEEMSKIRGDEVLAKKCRNLFEKGSSLIDSELWNGEYYVQKYDARKHKSTQYGVGCHSDQLLGQWWAHILDLGHILPEEHVKKALESIYRYNFRESLRGHTQKPRTYLKGEESGLLICTWPKGRRPDPVTLYSDEVWTGIEYPVAGLMFYEGMIEKGMEIVTKARIRHDGRFRNPWNEVECGDHYARPMSSWSMLEALSGHVYDGAQGTMRFRPMFKEGDFRCFFVAGGAWGTYAMTADLVHEIKVEYGSLELKEIWLPAPEKRQNSLRAFLGKKDLSKASISYEGAWIVAKDSFRIDRGQTLRIVAA